MVAASEKVKGHLGYNEDLYCETFMVANVNYVLKWTWFGYHHGQSRFYYVFVSQKKVLLVSSPFVIYNIFF